MSFFMRLFSRRQRQSREAHGNAGSRVHTHEEGEFVHVSLSAPAKSKRPEAEEEDADVSSWEMAQVLGRRPAAVVGRRPATMSSLDAHKKQAKRRDLTGRKSANVSRPGERAVEELHCMEDSAELDMFDDKRNRIIKRSHRRKMNFPDKYKF
ncbi:hypothetical protein HG536_0F01800 [Torulaspora globosa]|uniref:Uncharacterized protein n=1 Tax=Torulaspora globosa TaxID=48254 RepID=A0A7G3ZK19_9SACH|nr:uncharacterized protein HG536_0F01800 [Torulaspora globosa]QLL33855.1 hypothetical protein HG536_0F01800 [Torulaspora globosa]